MWQSPPINVRQFDFSRSPAMRAKWNYTPADLAPNTLTSFISEACGPIQSRARLLLFWSDGEPAEQVTDAIGRGLPAVYWNRPTAATSSIEVHTVTLVWTTLTCHTACPGPGWFSTSSFTRPFTRLSVFRDSSARPPVRSSVHLSALRDSYICCSLSTTFSYHYT